MSPTQRKLRRKVEFGDFQTPPALARDVVALLDRTGPEPASAVEPTCGEGVFVEAVIAGLAPKRIVGMEINPEHLRRARARLEAVGLGGRAELVEADFFATDWSGLLAELPEPILVVGNPPWVTSAALSRLQSRNLPDKSNFRRTRGVDAITGKSNFDISEWMMMRIVDAIDGRDARLAMLCKRAVARKIVRYAWEGGLAMREASIHAIDAAHHFDASVDACLLVYRSGRGAPTHACSVYASLDAMHPKATVGHDRGRLIADLSRFEKWKHLHGSEATTWRSGVKHDCAKVMELERVGSLYRNGLGEEVELEPDCVYPMLKSSEIARGGERKRDRHMLVTQRRVGDPTEPIRDACPRTWAYLERHAPRLDARASSIYRGRPRFSMFGIGDYAFAEWKVAIAGLYKSLAFRVVGPHEGRATMLDDTTAFLACGGEEEARLVASLLSSTPAREFFEAFVFWDAKRPLTIELLRRLDLDALARELGLETQLVRARCAG